MCLDIDLCSLLLAAARCIGRSHRVQQACTRSRPRRPDAKALANARRLRATRGRLRGELMNPVYVRLSCDVCAPSDDDLMLDPPGACSLPFAVRSAMPTDTMECELTSGRHGQCPNRTLTLGEESEIPSAERICVCSSVRSQDARAHTRNQSGSMMNERFRAAVDVRCSRLLKIIQQNEQFYGYPVSSTRRRTMYIISTL